MQISLSDLVLDQDAIDRLASGDTYFGPRTPFTDWQQAASDLARESEEEVAERAIELYSEVDPGRGRAMGGSTADLAFREIVQEPSAESWMEVYEREGLSPYKLDPETGEKFYINTPPGVNLVDLLEGEDKQEYLDLLQKQDFEVRASDRTYNVETGVGGIGAGDYGTVIRPPEVSGADRLTAIAAPLLASAMLGPLAGKLTAAAGATGATGTALTNALTGAASASLTGGDPVDAALIAGLGSLITPEISSVKEGVIETTTSPTSITSSEIPSDILSFQADIPDISTRGLLEGYTPTGFGTTRFELIYDQMSNITPNSYDKTLKVISIKTSILF